MKSSATPPAAPSAGEDELESAKSLLAVYEGLASLPLDECSPGDIEAIVRAIREDRIEDAVDLIDVTGELNAMDFAAEGERDCPNPAVAQIWRYDWKTPSNRLGKRLHSIDGPQGVPLRAMRTMPVKPDRRWVANVGELPALGRATLDVGLKGELFVLLFSGDLVMTNADGDVIGELCADEVGYAARHFVFCRGQDSKIDLAVQFAVQGTEPVRGIWCLSASETLSDEERLHDPHNRDVFVSRDLLRFHRNASTDDVFCPSAKPCPSKGYPHADIVEQGGLDRASLVGAEFTSDGGWNIDHPDRSTAMITGVRAGKARDASVSTRRRQLKAHGDGFELFVVLRGIAWVAVTSEKQGQSEMQRAYEFSHDIDDPDWLPAHMTGLTAAGESGHDVMLLNSSYYHTAWTQPDSDARFVHVFFPDPRAITMKSAHAHDVEPAHAPVEVPKRALGGSGQIRSALEHAPDTRRWARAAAVRNDTSDQVVVVTGPWEANVHGGPKPGCVGPQAASQC